MIKRLFAVILAVAAFSGLFSERTVAASSLASNIADGIISREANGNTKKWLASLSERAGEGTEWYAIALSRYSSDFDRSEYADALESYLTENDIRSAVSRQRCALALIACGKRDSAFVADIANDSIGEQGVMSLIFGLHLLNNGAVSDKYTVPSLVSELLSLRTSDGGWTVMGQYSDVDVTAMAIQALAPFYGNNHEVTEAINSALALLSAKQLDSGGFSSYGSENPESAAQVITALASLGKDITREPDFIKNGRTAVDAMADFRLADGGFSHSAEGEYNSLATAQAFYSCVSLILLDSGKKLYIFDESQTDNTTSGSESTAPIPSEQSSAQPSGQKSDIAGKPILICTLIFIGGIACIVMAVKGVRKPKDYLAVIAVTVILAAICCFTDIKTPEEYYSGSQTETAIGHVTFSVICNTALGKDGSENLPSDGILIAEMQVAFSENGTVYDVLAAAAKANRLPIASSGIGSSLYISGIGGISELDFGAQSGWIYLVNGVMPSISCAEYRLSDGDTVEWHYTCALGNDIPHE